MDRKTDRILATSLENRAFNLSREVLAGLWEGLWGEKRWRPNCAGQEGIRSLKLVTDPKVCNFNMAIFPQNQVGRLDVPMNDFLVMYCLGWIVAITFNHYYLLHFDDHQEELHTVS